MLLTSAVTTKANLVFVSPFLTVVEPMLGPATRAVCDLNLLDVSALLGFLARESVRSLS